MLVIQELTFQGGILQCFEVTWDTLIKSTKASNWWVPSRITNKFSSSKINVSQCNLRQYFWSFTHTHQVTIEKNRFSKNEHHYIKLVNVCTWTSFFQGFQKLNLEKEQIVFPFFEKKEITNDMDSFLTEIC